MPLRSRQYFHNNDILLEKHLKDFEVIWMSIIVNTIEGN